MKKKQTWRQWWQKFRFKYKVSVIDEKRFDEVFAVNLSPFSATVIAFSLFVVLVILISSLIVATPLQNFLPGYLDVRARRDIVAQAVALDSLEQKAELYDRYLGTMKKIIAGDITPDSIKTVEQITNIDINTLHAGKNEEKFRKRYEDGTYQSVSTGMNVRQTTGFGSQESFLFFRPASGSIVVGRQPSDGQPGIVLSVEPNSAIKSVREGRVLFVSRTPGNVYAILIQHGEGYVSSYRGCQKCLVMVGDEVKEGEAIALLAPKEKSEFAFSLWQNGVYVHPETVIAF